MIMYYPRTIPFAVDNYREHFVVVYISLHLSSCVCRAKKAQKQGKEISIDIGTEKSKREILTKTELEKILGFIASS